MANSEVNRAAVRRYQAKNREMLRLKARERLAKWRAENPEKYREQQRAWRAKNRERLNAQRREYHRGRSHSLRGARWVARLKSEYGLTPQQYAEMLARQGDRCAICRAEKAGGGFGSWHVDHDHNTGEVRGLLCNRCNMGLGLFRDDAATLEAAIQYLAAPVWRKVVGG